MLWTCGGSRPRRPSASRSASVKAVPLLNTGLWSQSTPLTGKARLTRLDFDFFKAVIFNSGDDQNKSNRQKISKSADAALDVNWQNPLLFCNAFARNVPL